LVLGDKAKTSIIKRYCHGSTTATAKSFKSTLGVDINSKTVKWDEKTTLYVQLWDLAGSDRFEKMSKLYYKDTQAAFVVCDATSPQKFELSSKWKQEVDQKCTFPGTDDEPLPMILLVDKAHQLSTPLSKEELEDFCIQNQFMAWFELDANYDVVESAVNLLVEKIFSIIRIRNCVVSTEALIPEEDIKPKEPGFFEMISSKVISPFLQKINSSTSLTTSEPVTPVLRASKSNKEITTIKNSEDEKDIVHT